MFYVVELTPYQMYCIEKIRDFYGDCLPDNSDQDILDFALGCMCSDIDSLERSMKNYE